MHDGRLEVSNQHTEKMTMNIVKKWIKLLWFGFTGVFICLPRSGADKETNESQISLTLYVLLRVLG